jgi:hypothetical protein
MEAAKPALCLWPPFKYVRLGFWLKKQESNHAHPQTTLLAGVQAWRLGAMMLLP